MALMNYFNNTNATQWIGSMCVPAGESRKVDAHFIPSETTITDESKPLISDSMFDALNVAKSIEKINNLTQDDLNAALLDEQANANRKGVIEAINKAQLAFKQSDYELDEELQSFSAHWSNQPLEQVQSHLNSDEMQSEEKQAFADILRSILGQE
jgi:hypothetical protein